MITKKKLLSLALSLNATNADAIASQDFPRSKEILAVSAGIAGVNGVIAKIGNNFFYAIERSNGMFALLG